MRRLLLLCTFSLAASACTRPPAAGESAPRAGSPSPEAPAGSATPASPSASSPSASASPAVALPVVQVWKGATCGCCSLWVEHLRGEGFTVEVTDTPDLAAVKTRLGVPQGLGSCHTAQIGPFVVEGHVPAREIKRLLADRPAGVAGLAVPGMPIGSPGMEVPGRPADPYAVVAFGPAGEAVFAQYR